MMLGPTTVKRPGWWGYGELVGYPVSGNISSPFGPRENIVTPAGPTGTFHTGIDIPAPKGTPIFAPCDFVVTFSGNVIDGGLDSAGGHGMFGRIDDSWGIGFWHMEGLQLDENHVVKRGDIIGQVGTTGLSTGDHLHFMLLHTKMIYGISWYPIDAFVDPMLYFDDTIVTPAVEPNADAFYADFISNSLRALAYNPPADYSAALLELARRVEYLRSILGG